MLPKDRDYFKRIYRLVYVLNKLDKGGKVTTRELSKEFNVSPRTVQRDIALLGEAGFPTVSIEKGIHSFMEGFSLKRAMLSKEEASLLSFLYDIARTLGGNFENSFRSILNKVLSKEYETPFYAKIPEGTKLKGIPFVKNLEKAIDNCQKITLKYQTPEKVKTYKLCPLKIIFYEGFWYLLSQVDGKDWILKFRLERIKDVILLRDSFEEPKNLKTMLEESVNIWFSERRNKKVVLKIEKDVAKFFKQKRYFPHQKIIKENKDGSLLLECKVSEYMEVIPTVLHWIPYISVIEPEEVRNEIRDLVRKYLEKI